MSEHTEGSVNAGFYLHAVGSVRTVYVLKAVTDKQKKVHVDAVVPCLATIFHVLLRD